jgi:hypothetical protein
MVKHKMSLATFLRLCAIFFWEICTVMCIKCVMLCTIVGDSQIGNSFLLLYKMESSIFTQAFMIMCLPSYCIPSHNCSVCIIRSAVKKMEYKVKCVIYTLKSSVWVCVLYCFQECTIPKFPFNHNGISNFTFHGIV